MCVEVKRSKVSLKKAQDALKEYEKCGGDEWLDSACFDTQQAIEFLLKGILLSFGIEYERKHDIYYLVELVRKTDLIVTRLDELELLAATLTSWEEGSRYGKGIKTSINTVRRFHNIYSDILQAFLDRQEERLTDL